MKKSLYVRLAITFLLLVIGLLFEYNVFEVNEIVTFVVFFISFVVIGYDILFEAIMNIFHRSFLDENFLMMIASLGAFIIGECEEAILVMLLYQIGEEFQRIAVNRSRKSIAGLVEIMPEYANLLVNDKIEVIDPDELKIDDIIVVKPGEKIPVDGRVIDGQSSIDTKSITGESIPKEVFKDSLVFGGCVNISGTIKAVVLKTYENSTVSKMLELVEEANSNKATSEKFITKFAKYYTPIVVFLAIILAFVPPIFSGYTNFKDWLYRALEFLVVSCPCALVISVPLGFFSGIGVASKNGILVKGSSNIEALSKINKIGFDKTGTLTRGAFEVTKIESSYKGFIDIVGSIESYFNHPIAVSIKSVCSNINESLVTNIVDLPGLGVRANYRNLDVLIGNERLLEENSIIFEKAKEIGKIIYVAIDNKFSGYIVIADTLKDESPNTIKAFKSSSIGTFMLTGDTNELASNIAHNLSLDTYYADLLPKDKVDKLKLIMNDDKNVAYVGDGINDAPVLATSSVGFAMGGLGSDAAIEVSDIVIMNDDISKTYDAYCISKKTMRIVKENIAFALIVKLVILIISAVGLGNMFLAIFADVGVSIIAILNAIRCLRYKAKKKK